MQSFTVAILQRVYYLIVIVRMRSFTVNILQTETIKRLLQNINI